MLNVRDTWPAAFHLLFVIALSFTQTHYPSPGYLVFNCTPLNSINRFHQFSCSHCRYTESIQIRCHRQVHLGNELDGGYHVCEDKHVVPIKPCLVYSFGYVYVMPKFSNFSKDKNIFLQFDYHMHSTMHSIILYSRNC